MRQRALRVALKAVVLAVKLLAAGVLKKWKGKVIKPVLVVVVAMTHIELALIEEREAVLFVTM